MPYNLTGDQRERDPTTAGLHYHACGTGVVKRGVKSGESTTIAVVLVPWKVRRAPRHAAYPVFFAAGGESNRPPVRLAAVTR